MTEAVSILTIDARGAEAGSAAYVRAMRLAQAAADRALDVDRKATEARERGALALVRQSDTIARSAQAWDRLRASVDPHVAAQKAIEQAQLRADSAVRKGVTTQEEAVRVLELVRKRYAETMAAVNDNSDAMGKLQRQGGLARHELINLGRQVQDVGTMLAMGSSPMQVFTSQIGQIVDVFSSSEGTVRGFLRQLAPVVPAIGAVSVAAYGMWAALSVFEGRRELENSLLGVGRAAGVTGAQLDRLASDAAASADISAASARTMAAEFTRTGKIAPEVTAQLIKQSKNYAATTAQDVAPAVKELAGLLSGDLVKAAEAINQKLGAFDSVALASIRRFEEMGNRGRAQQVIVDGISASVARAEETQSAWNRAIEKYLSLPWSKLKEGVGNALLPADDLARAEKELASIQSQIAQLRSQPSYFAQDGVLKQLEAEEQRLTTLLKAENDLAAARKERVDTNVRSNEARALFDSANPSVRSLSELNKAINAYELRLSDLRKQMGDLSLDPQRNSGRLSQMAAEALDYERQIARTGKALEDYASVERGLTIEQDKAVRLRKLEEEQVGKTSLAEQGAAAAKRTLIELRGSEMSATERSRQAEEARQRVLLQGRTAAAEQSQATNDNIQSLRAEADAFSKSGAEAAKAAALWARAGRETRGTGESQQVRYQELLMEAHSQVQKEIAEQTAQLKLQVQVSEKVNVTARQRGMNEQEIVRLQSREAEIQSLINKMKGGGASDAAIAAEVAKIVGYRERELSVEKERAALGMLASQRESLALLQLEVSLLGKSAEERARALAVLKAEQALRRQGIDVNSELGKQYVDGAKLEASLTATRDRFVDLSKDIGQIISGIFDDLFSKTDKGFAGVVDNALKSFAKLGSRLIEQQIITPLVQGRGLGHLFPSNDNSPADTKVVRDSIEDGAFSGIFKALGDFFKPIAGGTTPGGGTGSGLISMKGLGSLGMAGLAGFGIGQQSQNPLIGAIGGGLGGFAAGAASGFAFGGPIGAVIGAGAGILGGIMGQQQAKKKRRQEMMALLQQYQEEWQQMRPQADVFIRQMEGRPVGSLETSLTDAKTQAAQTATAAGKGGDSAAVDRINLALDAYITRTIKEFSDGVGGMLASLANGTGPNSPFNQARAAMVALGEQLTGFVADVTRASGQLGPATDAAAQAAAQFAIGSLKTVEPLSFVGQRMQEISGAASGLQQVLVDLGYSAETAAQAVQAGTTAALDQLREAFTRDLASKTNEAQGYGYRNEAKSLIDEVAQLRADAASLGLGQDGIDAYFKAAAQAIVDGADLTGQAFDDLLARFPALAGAVSEAGQAINATQRAIENASRRLQYQDRLFAALNDTTTLDGQLAAFDRQAQRDRAAEMKTGGDEILALEQALSAERLKIITSYYKEVQEKERRALEDAQNFFDSFSRNLREFVDGLRTGAQSPLSPEARLAAAQAQYNAQLALAQGGDRDAVNNLTKYASDLIDAAKGFYASSAGYQQVFEQVTAQLLALPTQVSAEQFIVDAIEENTESTVNATEFMRDYLGGVLSAGNPQAIANALSAYFNAIDTSLDGLVSYSELVAALGSTYSTGTLSSIFRELDTNGDGQLSLLELIKYATQSTSSNTAEANSLQNSANSLAATANSLQSSAIALQDTMANLLSAISSLNSTQVSTLAALNNQFAMTSSLTLRGSSVNNNMVTALNKIAYNTAYIMQYTGNAGGFGADNVGAYATGGWIRGPGSPTSDSIPLWASDGEFMVNAAAARRHASLLEAINGGADLADIAPIARTQIAPGPAFTPAPANQNGGDNREIVAELRRLNARIAQLEQALVEAEYGAAGLIVGEVAGVRQEQRKAAADARQDRNRPDRGKRVA